MRLSGADLLLNDQGELVGQVIDLTSGPTVGLDATGAPQRWSYPGIDGSTAWRSTGTAPSATATYDPWGTWNSASPAPTPHDPLSLIMDESGWSSGQGGMTSPVDPSLVQLGARTYDAVSGRFLQPDPQLESANPYAYADGDPIDGSDPSGNWGSWGDIFSTIMSVVVGVAAAILAPVTAGASGFILGALVVTAATAATDFGFSVIGQAIDQGGFSNIDWAGAGVSAAIGTGISLLTLGASRVVAAPRLLGLHQKAVTLFTNPSRWKVLRKMPATDIGDFLNYSNIKWQAQITAENGGSFAKQWSKGLAGRVLWTAPKRKLDRISMADLMGSTGSARSSTSPVDAFVVPSSSVRGPGPQNLQVIQPRQNSWQPANVSKSITDEKMIENSFSSSNSTSPVKAYIDNFERDKRMSDLYKLYQE